MVAVTELVQDHELISGGDRLKARLAVPSSSGAYEARHALVFCHGLPSQDPIPRNDRTYDLLIGRIARDLGWTTLALSLRGCAGSEGNFSVEAWMTDLNTAVEHLRSERDAEGVWLAGAGTGGSMAIAAGGHNPEVRGVAALAARADFDDWLAQPDRLIQHCRDINVVHDKNFPPDRDEWLAGFEKFRPVDAARMLGDRSLLLIHGESDLQVPLSDAEQIAEAHGSAALRVIPNGDHRLRHDPRAVALLMGWLDRQRAKY